MSRKPTMPFGNIAFGSDGKVRQHTEGLSDKKSEQEREIAERFSTMMGDMLPDGSSIQMLPEDDYDFCILDEKRRSLATCEATEIVLLDYCRRLTELEYMSNPPRETVYMGPGVYWAVEPDRKLRVVRQKIEDKVAKYYAKPSTGEFWLVIWSVSFPPLLSAIKDGRRDTSLSVAFAREQLLKSSSYPFDRIFLFYPYVRAEQVWPVCTRTVIT